MHHPRRARASWLSSHPLLLPEARLSSTVRPSTGCSLGHPPRARLPSCSPMSHRFSFSPPDIPGFPPPREASGFLSAIDGHGQEARAQAHCLGCSHFVPSCFLLKSSPRQLSLRPRPSGNVGLDFQESIFLQRFPHGPPSKA